MLNNQNAVLDFYSNSSLKDHSANSPLGHVILIPIYTVFALTHKFCMLSGERANTNFNLCIEQTRLEPNIYQTHGDYAYYYTVDGVSIQPINITEMDTLFQNH